MTTSSDEAWMRRAILLARRQVGLTDENPAVGWRPSEPEPIGES